MNPEIRPQKYTTTMVKLGTIFVKTVSSRVILKIVGATPQLDQNLKPTRNLCGQFFYKNLSIYTYIYIYICIYISRRQFRVFSRYRRRKVLKGRVLKFSGSSGSLLRTLCSDFYSSNAILRWFFKHLKIAILAFFT